MGRVKDTLIQIEEAMTAGQWATALELLAPFGESAPAYLLEAVKALAESDTE